MTENEAQRLTYISKDGLVCYKDHKSPNVISTYDIKATHSLDEACTIIDILLEKLADYEAIGTVEEIKRQLELAVDVYDNSERLINTTMDMLMEYQAIGTIEEFKALKEKNEPKKAIGKRKYDEAYCPACNEVISDGEFWALDEYVQHCNYCGQAVKGVDWSE